VTDRGLEISVDASVLRRILPPGVRLAQYLPCGQSSVYTFPVWVWDALGRTA
jgi:hypothetical protein